jgi:hypothetical protein
MANTQLNGFGQPIPQVKIHIQAQRCFHDGDPLDGEITHAKYYSKAKHAVYAYGQLVAEYPNYDIRIQQFKYYPNQTVGKSLTPKELQHMAEVDEFLEETA